MHLRPRVRVNINNGINNKASGRRARLFNHFHPLQLNAVNTIQSASIALIYRL